MALAEYFQRTVKHDVEWTAFPAGGGGRVRGALLKRMGLAPGWPDLLFLRKGVLYGLELKKPGGSVSPIQKYRHSRLVECGGITATAWEFDAAVLIARDWGLLR